MPITGRAQARERRRRERLESQIVWILGSPRSGSTWVLAMLGEHRRVVPIDEPLIGMYLGQFVSDVPGVDPAGLGAHDCTFPRQQRLKRSQFFADEFREVWRPHLRNLIVDRLDAEASRYAPDVEADGRIILVKEPNGSQAADLLLETLPQSRLIFLLRDGRDVVDSHLAAIEPGSWAGQRTGGGQARLSDSERAEAVTDAAHKWLWRTEITEAAFSAHPGPKQMVRYEDLLAEPVEHLGSLLRWLELDTSAEAVRETVERNAFDRMPEESTGPQRFHRAASPGLWRENLTAEEQRRMTEILGPKLAELGYER